MGKHLLLPFRQFSLFLFSISLGTVVYGQQTDGRSLIQNHLRQQAGSLQLSERTIESIDVTNDYIERGTGIRHIYAHQKINGLTVLDGAYSFHIKGTRTVDASNLVDLNTVQVLPVSISVTAEAAVHSLM